MWVLSAARPISPPSASMSLTIWPFAGPPIDGLHGISPTVLVFSVHSRVWQPRRAVARAASMPACPPPMTMISALFVLIVCLW